MSQVLQSQSQSKQINYKNRNPNYSNPNSRSNFQKRKKKKKNKPDVTSFTFAITVTSFTVHSFASLQSQSQLSVSHSIIHLLPSTVCIHRREILFLSLEISLKDSVMPPHTLPYLQPYAPHQHPGRRLNAFSLNCD